MTILYNMNAIGLILMSMTTMMMMTKVLVVPLKMLMNSQTWQKNQKPRVSTHFQIQTNLLTHIVLGHLGDKFPKQAQKPKSWNQLCSILLSNAIYYDIMFASQPS